jgi:hypothetical protein
MSRKPCRFLRVATTVEFETIHFFKIEKERASAAVDLERDRIFAARREASRFQ